MNGLNSMMVEHERTTLEFQRASWHLQEDRYAITNIKYTKSDIILAEPVQLDDSYRSIEAISGNEIVRTVPVLTISMREHEFLMKQEFAEYDRLWKELAGM